MKSATLLMSLCLCWGHSEPQLTRFDYSQRLMGISFDVSVYAPDEKVANETVEAAFSRVRALNAILSDYEPDSELNRLCRTSGTHQRVKVSSELWDVLKRSEFYSKQTDGAFDVTIGPLVRLWRKARKTKVLPTQQEIAAAQQRVGFQKLKFYDDIQSVELTVADMQLDLGGIAVGWACDDIRKLFLKNSLSRYMIDASGDILVGDPPPGAVGWKIGVAPLTDAEDAAPSRYLFLQNAAVSTAGDTFQHVEFGGIRYSHIVDPKTGLGLTDRSTVVVIAKDCTTADGLDTAISLIGPDRGMKLLAAHPGAECLILLAHPKAGPPSVFESQGFAKHQTRE